MTRASPRASAAPFAQSVGGPKPSLPQGDRQPQPKLRVLSDRFRVQRPGEGRPEVVLLGLEPAKPRPLPTRRGRDLFGQSQVVFRVPPTDPLRLTKLCELLHPILPDRLQKAVAQRVLLSRLGHYQRLVNHMLEQAQYLVRFGLISGAYRLRSLEREATSEYREPPEQLPLRFVE